MRCDLYLNFTHPFTAGALREVEICNFVYAYIWKEHLQVSLRVFLTLDFTFFLTDTVLTALPENLLADYFIKVFTSLKFFKFYTIQTVPFANLVLKFYCCIIVYLLPACS